MKRKILSLALALSLVLALVPAAATPALAAGYYEAIPLKYDCARDFSEGLAAINVGGKATQWGGAEGGKWGFIDKTGKEVIAPKYDFAGNFSEGLAFVRIDGKGGFIDATGKEVIKLENDLWLGYDEGGFKEGLAAVGVNDKYGYIDKSGKTVVPFKYDHAWSFCEEGLAAVCMDGKFGFIDKTCNEVIPLIYDGVNMKTAGFHEGLASVNTGGEFFNWTRGGKWGVINTAGEIVVEFKYDWAAGDFSEGVAHAFNVASYEDTDGIIWVNGFIDKDGEAAVVFDCEYTLGFSEGLAAVRQGSIDAFVFGFIDKDGNEVIPVKYADARSFSEGLAAVLDGKWGFLDKSGNIAVPLKYDYLGSFSGGLAAAALDGKWGFIALGNAPEPPDALDTASDWARPNITAAIEKGFVPLDIQNNYQNNITRQEFCRMAVMWLEYKLGKGIDAIVAEKGIPERMAHTFSDTSDPNILAAYRLGVTSGTAAPTADKPGQFTPNGTFDRQSAATMLRSACKVAGFEVDGWPDAGFADMGSVALWAQPGVNFCRANGIMSGDGVNFNPGELYSRQHSIITFNNIK